MPVKLPYSETRKMNLFKMLDFQIICFFQKKGLKTCHSFCSTKLWKQISWARSSDSKSMPHSEISNSDHQFFGSLKSKRGWPFGNNKPNLENIFQALRRTHFENKENFWINCLCVKAFMSWHTPNGAFASLHTYKGTFALWYTYKGAFTS